jgi:hypothetical protein
VQALYRCDEARRRRDGLGARDALAAGAMEPAARDALAAGAMEHRAGYSRLYGTLSRLDGRQARLDAGGRVR